MLKTKSSEQARIAGRLSKISRCLITLAVCFILVLSILPAQSQNSFEGSGISTYIVVFNDSAGVPAAAAAQDHVADKVSSHGGNVKYRYHIINGMAVTIPDFLVDELSRMPNVKYVEKDQRAYPMLNESIPQIGADQVWAEGYTGEGVKVGLIDTGVNASHPDLNDGKVIAWKDFVYSDQTTPRDLMGHGTHCAGIIAGTGNASRYNPGGPIRGVAPNASLVVAQVFDYSTGSTAYADMINALDWEVNEGAQVISISIGGPHAQSMDDAINNTVSRGVPVVVAAGNSGPYSETIRCPGDAPGAITVGNVDKSDDIAMTSSRGPNRDGSIKPDVVNVGTGVWSADAFSAGYVQKSGTSMATPMTAGVVALMLQKDPSLTPAQVKYILEQTAKPLGSSTPNNDYGWGRVQADYAANYPSSQYISDSLPDSPGTIQDSTPAITITLENDGTSDWSNANNVTLRGTGDAVSIGDDFLTLPVDVDIVPGGQYAWTINLGTPIPHGTYNLEYQMYANETPFGDIVSKVIRVNDSVWPGILQFDNTSYSVLKTAGNASIILDRTSGLDNLVTVNYSACDGNGTAGTDYVPISDILPFSQDQANAAFNVTILNDGVYRGVNKTVRLSLNNPGGGADIGVDSAVLTIIDDNPKLAANFTSNVTKGAVPLTVRFTDTSIGNPSGWQWNFGDDTGNATAKNPVHTFNNIGNYTVTLTTSNAGGNNSITKTNYINVTLASFTLSLHKGWNLVSTPLTPQNSSIASVIPADVKANLTIVWTYDNSNPQAPVWKYYKPTRVNNTLSTITDKTGYWFLMTNSSSFTITGTRPINDTIVIKNGWNMVGCPSMTNRSPSDLFGSYYLTWGYKNDSWYYYKPTRANNTLQAIEPGYGYWVLKT